ncbi:MAG: TrpR, YerC/YecD [Candidatus Harrisonbacteria bacterium CG10_big_fil_rev_8_21_14_0_10_45_28]|uniref:TrpR, YerC/YecD n=1 Tax=Candidatus Harrisonbacteria bacterium CG10_big_fil_rev_8_21_14_0_10_45_28 TaxID=1974586 RepID=A0A2H0UMM4_9BACT|nr:MAG: TrpR, YerC/YecD [Candidatus Harrisonbacteria bacterium CG10_big_fil_rev_8_21_14_0_10_45_28]
MNKIRTKTEFIDLYRAIVSLKDENEARAFLRDLLTEPELKEFANRWTAAQMLSQKAPYAEIIKTTGLSSTTVARVSQWLTQGKGGYTAIINRLTINDSHHHNEPFVGRG